MRLDLKFQPILTPGRWRIKSNCYLLKITVRHSFRWPNGFETENLRYILAQYVKPSLPVEFEHKRTFRRAPTVPNCETASCNRCERGFCAIVTALTLWLAAIHAHTHSHISSPSPSHLQPRRKPSLSLSWRWKSREGFGGEASLEVDLHLLHLLPLHWSLLER